MFSEDQKLTFDRLLDMPMIRIEVENMKHTIVRGLGQYAQEFTEHMNEQIGAAIENYPWEIMVKREIDKVISREIEHFFSAWMPGGEAVRDAVRKGLSEQFGLEKTDDS